MSIKGVIFDFDGLILDTETAWYHAFDHVFAKYNQTLPLEKYLQVVGTTFDAFHPDDYLQELIGERLDKAILFQQRKEKYEQIMLEQDLRPGVREYLSEAKRMGLKIGLASSSEREWVEHYLRAHHIYDYFETINTSDDVEHVKPDPALYLRALDKLGIKGEEAIAFEDSGHGAHAAVSAGIHCVWVPNTITTHRPPEKEVSLTLHSMADKSFSDVIQAVQSTS
ncbi:HAD family hydrolase [Caldalkalibacillus salinus]|uniref:HAD family hydrolase n=1 Tax=Caldalkalibacillus salinus TaxID=2803787 RepID=UPI001F2B1DDD|nr:HAD family hydrolase [Caldalkalibacillus salinus]